MSDASAPAACPTITIRVPLEVKALFSDLAAKQGVSESVLALRGVRWLLDCADRFPPHPVQETGPATDRITIRLRPGDGRGIAIQANRRAMKPSAYLAGLVRAHIASNPPLATTELAALKQAVAVLAGIGSELALLRRGLQDNSRSPTETRAMVERALRSVEAIEDRVHDLALAAREAWESHYG
jgi:hypothetical protein